MGHTLLKPCSEAATISCQVEPEGEAPASGSESESPGKLLKLHLPTLWAPESEALSGLSNLCFDNPPEDSNHRPEGNGPRPSDQDTLGFLRAKQTQRKEARKMREE